MKTSKYIPIGILTCLLSACDTPTSEPSPEWLATHITPLSPYTSEFMGGDGPARVDHYFIDRSANWRSSAFRNHIREEQEAVRLKDMSGINTYSIYIYAKSTELNEHYTGDFDQLRGAHRGDMISYARWK